MRDKKFIVIFWAVLLMIASIVPLASSDFFEIKNSDNKNKNLIIVEDGPILISKLYYDGSIVELESEKITKPMVGSNLEDLSLDDFKDIVFSNRKKFYENPNKFEISGDGASRGLNIIFVTDGSVPSEAITALNSVASYIESKFDDNVEVRISVDFESMGSGIIGATSIDYAGYVSWTNTCNGLQNDMDENDIIQDFLPSGNTIPVRYSYGSTSITNENRCYFAKANYRAAIGTVSGYYVASMTFNSDFPFDYDPSNGVGGSSMCFQSVAAHETGHALGFASGADFRYNDIESLDIFRFQRDDGANDYNPDSYSEFQTTSRLVYLDDWGTVSEDVNSDIITNEYRMEDGYPYQASHFDESIAAIMDPTLSYGQTFYPNFYRDADLKMFDAIGWDYPIFSNEPPYAPSNPSPSDGEIGVNIDDDLSWVGGDPDVGDTVVYDVYFEANDASPDVIVSDDQTETNYDPGTLSYSTHYYWQIVSKDNHGETTVGPVWDFWTEDSGETPDVSVNIWSDMTEVSRNTDFIFWVTITNNEPTPQTLKVWTAARKLSGGNMFEPLKGPITITIGAGQQKVYANIHHRIGNVPLTTYRYYARVGEDCPEPMWNEDYHDFTVII